MNISYAILTHNEGEYVENLLAFLIEHKQPGDEIIVVDDYSDDELTKSILKKYNDFIKLDYRVFDNEELQRAHLLSHCTKDYIFTFDADEIITVEFIKMLPTVLETNPDVEMFYVPRVNTVEGLTQEHIEKWKWRVNEKGWINFPDYQIRLHKNLPHIKWVGFVHSTMKGFNNFVALPAEELFSILHYKGIAKQEQQNNQYDKIENNGRTKYKV
jgi:glycosyltransferase involved in cell wall biosynthesis